MARGTYTFMFVLGGLALILGLVLVVQGPDLVEGGYEEPDGGPFGSDERTLAPAGEQIRNVGWVVTATGAILLLIGTGVLVTGRSRPG